MFNTKLVKTLIIDQPQPPTAILFIYLLNNSINFLNQFSQPISSISSKNLRQLFFQKGKKLMSISIGLDASRALNEAVRSVGFIYIFIYWHEIHEFM